MHGFDQSLVFVEHLVEDRDQLLQFAAIPSGRNSLTPLARVQDAPYGLDDLPDRPECPKREKPPADGSEQKNRHHHYEENRPELGKQLFFFIRVFADLQYQIL